MEAHLLKVAGGFVPAASVDEEALAGIKAGKVIKCKFTRPRNGAHHRKMFALLQIVLNNTDRYKNIDQLLTEIKLQVGHYEEHVTLDGELILVPKSIAFSSMDQDEFDVFYKRALDVIVEKMMVGSTADEIERAAQQITGFL